MYASAASPTLCAPSRRDVIHEHISAWTKPELYQVLKMEEEVTEGRPRLEEERNLTF